MQTYSQKVETWLRTSSNFGLVDCCRKFNYYPTALKVMMLDETDEKKSKPIIARDKDLRELYTRISKDAKAKSYKGENRSWTQYFKDLITGWIVEDLVLEMLHRQGLDIRHNGKDQNRVITCGRNVGQDADFLVTVGDVSRKVELTCEFNHILEQQGFIEKRAPALFRLWENKGIWVYKCLDSSKYVLVDFATEPICLHLRHHNTSTRGWSKDVHRYVLSENNKHMRDDRMLVAELISVVGCSIEGKEQPKLTEIEDKDSPPTVFSIGGNFREKEPSKEAKVVSVAQSKPKAELPPKQTVRKPEPKQVQEEEITTSFSDGFDDVDFV